MRRKILVLSPCDIFPPVHGSSTAVYHTLRFLAERHRVLAVVARLYSEAGACDLGGPNLEVRCARASPLDRLGYKGLMFNPAFYRAALAACRNFCPEVIQAELLWSAPCALWLRARTGVPVVLVQENVEYDKFARFGRRGLALELLRLLEGRCLRAADALTALSAADREAMTRLYGLPPGRFAIVPHGVDEELFRFREAGAAAAREKLGVPAGEPLLLFVGKLDYLPNARAARYLREVLAPAIWARHPGARFAMVGQRPPAAAAAGDARILHAGFVDMRPGTGPNLSDYYSAADVVLAPLDAGSGTRLKIVEAAACSRAVVSTALGAEGQDFAHGRELLLAELAGGAFARAVLELLADPGRRARLGEAARRLVLARYTWRAQVARFEKVYEELARRRVRYSP